METKFGGKAHHVYGPVLPEMNGVGKSSLEWDLNDWKWDGDLFTASPLNPLPSDCRNRQLLQVEPQIPASGNLSNSSSGSDDVGLGNKKGKREMEKRRRVVPEDEELDDGAGSLHLKLGGQIFPIMEGEAKSGKKLKIVGTSSNRVVCQVEDCRADLSDAKDYHRRHKVCDMHSKASKALVGSVMQRFCQQCSRFHALEEFDEGKRSCRRRLAGHNRRRRKTHPDAVANEGSLNDESSSSYLLISLLRILSNMHSTSSDHTKDQDLLSHLLRNLAGLAGSINGRNIAAVLEGSQGFSNAGTSNGTLQNVPDINSNGSQPTRPSDSACNIDDGVLLQDPSKSIGQHVIVPAYDVSQKCTPPDDAGLGNLCSPPGPQSTNALSLPSHSVAIDTTVERTNLSNIDLNNVYDGTQEDVENPRKSHALVSSGIGSLHDLRVQCDSHKSSLPHASGNSDSTSSSSGEAQSCTDRIVFKLFGKDPNDFPLALRSQILDWLSHSPTDIESYIRPGCIILTIYLHLKKSTWEELCCDLGSSLERLLAASSDSFWRTGWVYARVRHSVTFLYNGQVVLDVPLPWRSSQSFKISSIKPIAVSASAGAQFVVKGFNLSQSRTKLLCALEGKYLVRESCYGITEGADTALEHDELQSLSFSCCIPNVTGRGFIEIEDHGLSSSSFPFIVSDQEICSEICTLEDVIEAAEGADVIQTESKKLEEKTQALDFIHEMGWLLHRSHVKHRLGHKDPTYTLFPFKRFKWLVEFSVDHDWCAVVKKLLDVLFQGRVDAGEHPSIELALLEMCLLHRAVKRNCRPMVEFLLRFVPVKNFDKTDGEGKQLDDKDYIRFFFKPNIVGPAGLTPLHVAASKGGSENVLDALIDDPDSVGIEAWKSARDSNGLTPNDYACMQAHYSYIHLVQKKISKKSDSKHVVLDIPGSIVGCNIKQKLSDANKSTKVASLQQTKKIETKTVASRCELCHQKLAYGNMRTSLLYRPAMLSVVAIAAVCVCVALLFKSSPKVLYVLEPFTWESLKYGPI
ncbi:putative Squamosa promoter-binding protein [Quillaja saponaria]|uniref:Squamosa promoter-binding protein n=1 Tax=Quillaja saponaria TaxID=32244 RepID=A0AAD7PHI6_QUISA|nr:putative Squamosa promoter-binding protein [Quillaja saponaria]